MLVRSILAGFVLVVLVVCAHAEEAPVVDLPYKVEVKGDKLETVEFKWSLKREFKRGTPRELLGEYLLVFGENKDNPAFAAEKEKLEAMVSDYVHRLRFSVIEPGLAKTLEDGEKSDKEKSKASGKTTGSVSRTHLAPIIAAEEKQDSGKVLVLIDWPLEEALVDKNGIETKTKSIEKHRVLCAKVGDLWAVEKHETLKEDRRGGSKTWQVQNKIQDFLQFAAYLDELLPKLVNTSAEEGARFIVKNLTGFGEEFGAQVYAIVKFSAPLMELVKPLFTPESYKAAEVAAHDALEKDKQHKKENPEKVREIETHEKSEGIETFLFKPDSEWGSKHWLKMKQTADGWILVEIKKFIRKTQYEKDGSVKETWEPKPVEKFSDIGW